MEPKQLKSYLQLLFYRCMRMLQDRDMAWEAVQEVMTRYYEALPSREIHEPLHYLYRASTHHCIDLLQARSRTIPLDFTTLSLTSSSSQASIAEGKLLVERLLRAFTREEVALLLHRYVDQMTYQELGDLFACSDRGIKKRLDGLEARIQAYLHPRENP